MKIKERKWDSKKKYGAIPNDEETINQVISLILFSCKYVLNDDALVETIKHLTSFNILYSSGLRLSEAAKLKPADIDSRRKMVFIRGGKGRKDRYPLLLNKALNTLRQYMVDYQIENWLFPGQRKGTNLSKCSVQNIMQKSLKKA